MSKASRRRTEARAEFLRGLARTDPGLFIQEWTKRVESWSREIRRNTVCMRDKHGHPVPLIANVVDHAEEQLLACGHEAHALESSSTREILLNEAGIALARVVDRRSYRTTTTGGASSQAELYRIRRSEAK